MFNTSLTWEQITLFSTIMHKRVNKTYFWKGSIHRGGGGGWRWTGFRTQVGGAGVAKLGKSAQKEWKFQKIRLRHGSYLTEKYSNFDILGRNRPFCHKKANKSLAALFATIKNKLQLSRNSQLGWVGSIPDFWVNVYNINVYMYALYVSA